MTMKSNCVWLLCFVVCVQRLPAAVECRQKLINIDFLGIGYDAIQGNPQSDLEDPGFRLVRHRGTTEAIQLPFGVGPRIHVSY